MIELLYKSGDFEDKFIECMKKYQSYYWATGWAGHGFRAYELLLQEEYRSKIKVLATGVYDTNGYTKTSKTFMKSFIDTDGVYFIGYVEPEKLKGMNPLHSKEYLFYTDDFHWELFIGSANFTKAGFCTNYEAVLHINQDSGEINEIMPFFKDKDNLLFHTLTKSRIIRLIGEN